MSKKITVYKYLATNVPADVHFVLNRFSSYRKARNTEELEYQIKDFVKTYGENGLKALSEIHPDRELISVDCHNCKQKEETIDKLKIDSKKILEKEPMSYFNANGENVCCRWFYHFRSSVIIKTK